MSSYYDKYGGAPAYASVGANISGSTFQEGIYSSVPSNNNENISTKRVPNFKTLFEDYKLHNPQEHRAYLFVPFTFRDNRVWDSYVNGTYFSNHKSQIKQFDKTKVDFQTVTSDDMEYLAPGTEFVEYLKEQDEAFALTVTELNYYKNHFFNIWNSQPYYRKYESPVYPNHFKAMAAYDNEIQNVNNQFKTFVADCCRSLIRLNKPFYADVGGDYHLPVSVGNFSAYELDNFVNSVFGNVTDDNFIHEANEEIYEAKTPTTCCLKVCYSPTLYRKDNVPYEESKQYTQDQEEWQKWINSDEYTPYVPPPPQKEITLEQYSRYLNEAQSFARSPLMYAFEKFKPYLEKGLINLKNGGYIDDYKVHGNEIYIEI
jgi:hypothetical protein